MKATIRAESDHNRKAQVHEDKVGQQIWWDERNFLSKNRKLAANWSGPFIITKVRDIGNIGINLDRKEINVNVNHINYCINSRTTRATRNPSQTQPKVQNSPPGRKGSNSGEGGATLDRSEKKTRPKTKTNASARAKLREE